MKKIKKSHFSFIIQIIFFISIFNSIYAKNFEKNYDANSFSNYFSGILSLNEKKYENSYKYLKTLKGLEKKHFRFSTAYQESLISLDRFDEAIERGLWTPRRNSVQSDLGRFRAHIEETLT